MIDCFTTQRWLLEQFDLSAERLRIAPEYDFRRPPHAGELHYETLGWGITGENWRRAAAEALQRLGLDAEQMPLTVLSVGYAMAPVGPDAVGGAEQILTALGSRLNQIHHVTTAARITAAAKLLASLS